MTIEYKFVAKNDKESEIEALKNLKNNIENKRMCSLERVKSTILPIRNVGLTRNFSIVLKCKGDFDRCGYKARMNDPKKITNLLCRLSEKTGVNYKVFTPEMLYSEMSRTERFVRNGVSYTVHIKLEPFDSSSPDRKTRILTHVDALNVATGNFVNDFSHCDFYRSENVPESRILESIDDAIRRVNNCIGIVCL